MIRGESSKRCIGTGVSSSPTGPFAPRARPISCVAGTARRIPGRAWRRSELDDRRDAGVGECQRRATPCSSPQTQHRKADGHYFSTIRMVQLNVGDYASSVIGKSHTLTVRPDNIEENPVLIQRGKLLTLFTSLGGYTLCSYHTEWRQSTHLWKWPAASHRLSFPAGTNTCGTGDAHVLRGLPRNSWSGLLRPLPRRLVELQALRGDGRLVGGHAGGDVDPGASGGTGAVGESDDGAGVGAGYGSRESRLRPRRTATG